MLLVKELLLLVKELTRRREGLQCDGRVFVTDFERTRGMVGIERLSDDEAEVRRMYVDAGWRRRGIGSRLLAHAENFCAGAGYARIVLSTSALQEAAKALYEARGYRLVRQVVADEQTNRTVGGGIRRYHYVKEL